MTEIFIGFFFLFLNFNIDFSSSGWLGTVNFLPNWLGYVLILRGAAQLTGEGGRFVRLRPTAILAAVYTLMEWGLALVGMSSTQSWIAMLNTLLTVALSVLVSYQIVQGILEMETRWGDLGGESLKRRWEVMVVLECVGCLMVMLPLFMVIVSVAAVIASVLFLLAMYRAQKRYAERRKQPPLE